MVRVKEVTAEHRHKHPVRSDISLGATEMPEKKNNLKFNNKTQQQDARAGPVVF